MERIVTLSNGVRLEYVEQGPAHGRPVIFLHGVTDSWHSFERVLPLLPPDVRVFALSQRGHGDSSRPASGYRLTELAADVAAFMDALGLSTATIVGHSMGASVAQRFVLDHPHRTMAIALAGTFATYRDQEFRDFVVSSILPLRDPIAPAFAREWQLSTLAQPMDGDHFATVIDETLKVPAAVWHACFQGFIETDDFTEALATVSVPCLLLWGEQDAYTGRAAQERLLAAIPGARLEVYAGFGHALHWEDPARFAGDIAVFLDSVGQRAPAGTGGA